MFATENINSNTETKDYTRFLSNFAKVSQCFILKTGRLKSENLLNPFFGMNVSASFTREINCHPFPDNFCPKIVQNLKNIRENRDKLLP